MNLKDKIVELLREKNMDMAPKDILNGLQERGVDTNFFEIRKAIWALIDYEVEFTPQFTIRIKK
jgi:hypothetical protein